MLDPDQPVAGLAPERGGVAPPPWALFLSEGRAVYEMGLFYQALPVLLTGPRGDGHPVMVLPGFTASDLSTTLLRGVLRRRGYDARGWALGRNLGFSPQLELRMARRLQTLHWRSGRKVSLVGWSLGGIFARELARLHPEMVRQVISLGSPFAASPRATNVWRFYERITGQSVDELDPTLQRRMRLPPPVPSTAVYSRTDGKSDALRRSCWMRSRYTTSASGNTASRSWLIVTGQSSHTLGSSVGGATSVTCAPSIANACAPLRALSLLARRTKQP